MKLLFFKIITTFFLVLILTEVGFELINAVDSLANIIGFILSVMVIFCAIIVVNLNEIPRLKFSKSKK
jgi:O-antigen ligase